MTNLIPYRDNVALNLITSVLVIVGGIGFPVILDLGRQRNFRRLTLHTKVVLVTTGILLAGGTLLLKLTEPISWMAAFFHSMSARTAGFSTCSLGSFSNGGLFVICILMFIGASSGSTGGGVKTSTMFVLLQSVRSEFSKRPVGAFRRSIPKENVFIMQSGEVLELCDDYAKVVDKVHTGAILVDGLGVGDVGNIVLRDRQHLAEDGIIIVVLTLERRTNRLLAGPDIVSRGFVYAMNDYIWKKTKRRPMVIPIIMDVDV